MNKQQAIENVNGMSPSLVLFTKEQVVEIIESLEQPTVPAENTISREGLHEILMEYGSTMIHKIRKYVDFNDVVDEDTAEFSLCGNEIVLDSVNVDSDKICDEIENSLDLEELASNLIERLFPMSEVMEITITED
jgi:hypothetical protein